MWRHYTDSGPMSVITVRPVEFARRVRCSQRPQRRDEERRHSCQPSTRIRAHAASTWEAPCMYNALNESLFQSYEVRPCEILAPKDADE
jgi:hypothetical protein